MNAPRAAYAVVMTSETAKYGNILLKKRVTPVRRIEPVGIPMRMGVADAPFLYALRSR